MLSKKEIKSLAKSQSLTCVSIFIPTHRSGFQNCKIDNLRFKNALGTARQELEMKGMQPNEIHGLLQPAYEMMEDDQFWTQLSDGLAVFISPNRFEYYELPISFNSFVYVGEEFYLRPLLPMLTGNGRFFVLALSQNEVRFFEGTRSSITPIIIEDLVPENVEEAVFSEEVEANLQAHSGASTSSGAPIYHGHGGGKDERLKRLSKYFSQIDGGLMQMLHDENAPLLIASVDYLKPIYAEVSKYKNIMGFSLKGNFEQESPVQIHEKAWSLMAPFFKQKQIDASNAYLESLSHGKASSDIHKVVPGSMQGRLDTLFINKDVFNVWGYFQMGSGSIALQDKRRPYSTCLFNAAAIQTFLQGGTVYNVSKEELPTPSSDICGHFRF